MFTFRRLNTEMSPNSPFSVFVPWRKFPHHTSVSLSKLFVIKIMLVHDQDV